MASAMALIATETQHTLSRLARLLPPAPPPAFVPSSRPAPLDLRGIDARPELLRIECRDRTATGLQHIFDLAQGELQQTSHANFERTCRDLVSLCPTEAAWKEYERVLRSRYTQDYVAARDRALSSLLVEVQRARDAVAASTSLSDSGRGNFANEVVEILERAFAQQTTLNRAERRSLAEATGLEEKQVGTWFANQRQRRRPSQQRERTAPYDVSSRPRGRRDFSRSSASSMSSLNSALSDISTAPSSVESWISSLASSTMSYDWETLPSSTREASPLPFGALPSFDDQAYAAPAPHHHPIKQEQGYRVASACGPPPSWTSPIPTVSTTLPTPSPSLSSFPCSSLPASSSSIHPFFASPTTTTSFNPKTFTFDAPPPPPSPTTAHLLSTAPFLQGFDFEQDPQDGAFWQQFLQGGFGAELGLGGGEVSFGVSEGGAPVEGGEQMSLMLPMPTPTEEEYPCGIDWGGVGGQ